MSNETTALAPFERQQMGALRPIVRPDEMVQAIKEYEALKAAILQKKDVQRIGDKQHVKKSGWLRIARAFGVTVEPVSEQFVVDDSGWGYAIVVRAVAPNGASMQGDGMCWNTEKADKQRTRHNVRAHAYTRATNRAISNLVGGGEVSAEELQDFRDDDDDAPSFSPPRQIRQAAPQRTVSADPAPQRPVEREPSAESGGVSRPPTPQQVKIVGQLAQLLGEPLPTGLTFQSAGKVIAEWQIELRRRKQPQRVAEQNETSTPDEEAPFDLRGDPVPQGA